MQSLPGKNLKNMSDKDIKKFQGWIKLHRSLLEWEWFGDQNTTRLFIFLLLSVNYEPRNWHGQQILAGQIATSLPSLSQKTGLTIQQLRTSLNKLISTGEITDKKTAKHRVITVNNYEKFQELTGLQQDNNRIITGNQQGSNREVTATKEYKNKEVRKKESSLLDSIESRKQKFLDELNSLKNYSQSTRNDFYNYWTEMSITKRKMRFELQSTWETSKRLRTWAARENPSKFTKVENATSTRYNRNPVSF